MRKENLMDHITVVVCFHLENVITRARIYIYKYNTIASGITQVVQFFPSQQLWLGCYDVIFVNTELYKDHEKLLLALVITLPRG